MTSRATHNKESDTRLAYFELVSRIHARLPEISEQVFSRRNHINSNSDAEFLFGRLLVLTNDQSLKTELEDDHDLSLKHAYITSLVEKLDQMILPAPTLHNQNRKLSSSMRS